jgi:hypothetical protein
MTKLWDKLLMSLGVVGGGAVIVLGLVYAVTIIAAFVTGLDVWIGAPVWLQYGLAFLAIPLFQLAAIPMLIIAFVGAMEGWGWEWWQAGLLCFPGIPLMIAALFGTAIFSGAEALTRRNRS